MSEKLPVNLLNVYGQPFGHSIVSSMEDARNPRTSIRKNAHKLRKSVATLLSSPSEEYSDVVQSINHNFNTKDRHAYESHESDAQPVGNMSVLEWLAGASDKDLVAFAKWNVERHQQLTTLLEAYQDELIDAAIEKTEHLIDLDLFPKKALRAVRRAASIYSPFKAMDSFESGAIHAVGYFDTNTIRLANLYTSGEDRYPETQQLEQTTFHELLHASGHIEEQGFHFHDTPVSGRIWEEAFISHSVGVAFTPEHIAPLPDIYDPAERPGNTVFSYSDERRTIGFLSSPDIADIPADLWGRAFFDRANQHQQKALARKLRLGFQALTSSEDGYETFSSAYEDTWYPDDRKSRDKLLEDIENSVYEFRGVELIDESSMGVFADEDTPWMAFEIVEQA